ncbi:MAG TPA: transposase [Gemmataceae bacterium]|nr:transposase [Gemmataceae bacterium]
MPRSARQTPGGYVYHALNRATARLKLFRKAADYEAFLRVLDEALEKHPLRVLGYCIMPTHWHFVLWPAAEGQLTAFLRWLTLTHSVRWHKHHHSTGSGHVYQNRFKAFAVAEDEHLLSVLRYVERNPLRAGLVRRAEDWPWSSLACRLAGGEVALRRLHPGPVVLPANWPQLVNKPQTEAELAAMRQSVARGRPYGSDRWVQRVVKRLGLQSTIRPRGRPRKRPDDARKGGK